MLLVSNQLLLVGSLCRFAGESWHHCHDCRKLSAL